MATAKVTRKGEFNFNVQFTSLTQSELLALRHALEGYDTPIGQDVRAYLLNALQLADLSYKD